MNALDPNVLFAHVLAALIRHPLVAAAIREVNGRASSPDECVRLDEAARTAGIGGKDRARTLAAAFKRDGVPTAKLGGRRVVSRADLSRWIESKRIAPVEKSEVTDPRAEARAAVARSAARIMRSK